MPLQRFVLYLCALLALGGSQALPSGSSAPLMGYGALRLRGGAARAPLGGLGAPLFKQSELFDVTAAIGVVQESHRCVPSSKP